MTMWMVRAGSNSVYINDFLDKNIVFVDLGKTGNISGLEKSEIESSVLENYSFKKRGVSSRVNNLYNFSSLIDLGDYVISYDSSSKIYHIGLIESDYQFSDEEILEDINHYREVKWISEINRDDLDELAKKALNSSRSVFELSEEAQDDILAILELDSESESGDEFESNIKSHFEYFKETIGEIFEKESPLLVSGFLVAFTIRDGVSQIRSKF